MKRLILIVALMLSATSFVCAQDNPLLMRTPTLNKTHIVFSYAGDLWTVGRDGGEASRLTTGVGREFSPLFSPNGQWIAFTAEYDGNVDIYVMPASGGVPRRLTYHPAQINCRAGRPTENLCSLSQVAAPRPAARRSSLRSQLMAFIRRRCRSRWLTRVLTQRTARAWRTCRYHARSMPGSVIAAGRRLPFSSLT